MPQAGAKCIVEDCPTYVQRAQHGTLADGANMHLSIVHPELYAKGLRAAETNGANGKRLGREPG